ncbi:MAG: hypothetical protein ACRES2_00280 [Steroidobacteraceae bacterium]
MKPLTVLLGIVLGSAAALAVSLTMTGIVFLLLPEYSARLGPEERPLLTALAWSWSLTLAAAAAFVGELQGRAWRRPAQALVVLFLVALAWRYWPA